MERDRLAEAALERGRMLPKARGELGGVDDFAKFTLPMVADGRVYVPIFCHTVVAYGLRQAVNTTAPTDTPAPPSAPAAKSTCPRL